MSENITKKVWGIKQRVLENSLCEIDLLFLDKNTACSVHTHEHKINRFVLLSGSVSIKTDLGSYKLQQYNPFDVEPPLKHQFVVNEDSLLLEIAYVNNRKIDPDDINRYIQGGKFIDNVFYTLHELKDKNWV